ncbi:NAD(P)-binding protein [Microthyrium microscopicum]|uniref:3-dehydrosphinganine reductase n=1 Tax=Microthyrium microscopicum TaxID=703497 RepID=A0A6A6UAC3_9PEZI|nr:NAD(P)-binding protein [Microthyrium microscopicum]
MKLSMPSYSILLSSLFLALPLIIYTMGLFTRKSQFVVDGRTVLITGASQGLGRALAKLLAQKGANVIVVARSEDKLKAVVAECRAAAIHSSQRFTHFAIDLTSPAANTQLLADATQWNDNVPPPIIWANAGSAYPHLLADTPVDTLRSQMDIDYWAAAYLAKESIAAWISTSTNDTKESKGKDGLPNHLIMTSSVIAFAPLAGYGPYAPAKAALRALADTLRSELHLYNGARLHKSSPSTHPELRNHVVFPSGITTEGFDAENLVKHPVTKILEEDDKPQTPEEVAIAAVRGLERGEYMITTNALGYLMKVSSLGGSKRNGWAVLDTVGSWVGSLVWLFVGPDLDSKVFKWGKANGVNGSS